MGDNSRIEWTDATWNPVVGCTKVSDGCDHCYAETLVNTRLRHRYPAGFSTVVLHPERLDQPLRWRRPRRVFVNSLSDLFEAQVPDAYICRVFDVMCNATRHTFQVLTKRPGRMASFVRRYLHGAFAADPAAGPLLGELPANVWLGTSVESQRWADVRVPQLLRVPSVAVRFLSCEPLLGPVDLGSAALRPYERQQGGYWEYGHGEDVYGNGRQWVPAPPAQIDWVIVGGESGPGARPMDLGWAHSLVRQCRDAGVAVFVKQLGEVWARARRADRGTADPKGGDWDRWPPDLRVREYPTSERTPV